MTRLSRTILVLCAVIIGAIGSTPALADQPRMREARQHLAAARAALQRADANKGGHRVKAIDYVNLAITEVDRGMAFDRRNNHAQPTTSLPPDQPNMRAALEELNKAKRNLNDATNDKGGHRVKALEYVDKAINEVNAGIAAAS
jgi:hypothetical protein